MMLDQTKRLARGVSSGAAFHDAKALLTSALRWVLPNSSRHRRRQDSAGPLLPLGDNFRALVRGAFDDPWPPTRNVLDHLALDVVTTYLRGDRSSGGEPSWSCQLAFSACAGMADVSAEVATHWAEIWYRKSADELGAGDIGDVDLTREWRELDEALGAARAAGACLCQFCAPAPDVSRFDRLSIVKRFNQP